MKILAINGSPKGQKSSTHVMVNSFLEGAKKQGALVENIFLSNMNINYCKGCFVCWTTTPGKCIFKDDMVELLPKIRESDIVILGSPLYCNNITGNLKTFIDRMLPLGTPYFEKDENGLYRHGEEGHDWAPKFIMMSNCGFPEKDHFDCISLWVKRFARNCKGEVIAEIYKGQGPLLVSKSDKLKKAIDEYKSVLRTAGEEIVTSGTLSEATKEALNKDIIPHEDYIRNATSNWNNKRP